MNHVALPSPTVMAARRIVTLDFRKAGFVRGCDSPDTGGIFFQ
jgi:hypothetical protein